MNVAIVGSRRYKNKEKILELVKRLPDDAIVISGGAPGPDTWAIEAARNRGLRTKVIRPNLKDCKKKWEIVKAYYDRNRRIALEADIMIAHTADDRKGGVENAIKHMLDLKKEVKIAVE